MSKIVCIIQARTGSSRLPGKVLKTLMGKPLLEHVIDRVKQARTIDEIVIATTLKENDQKIIRLAKDNQVSYFCGDEDDVLARYYGAAQITEAEIIVRITSDCPLIDPQTIDCTVNSFLENDLDYLAVGVKSGYPRGLDTEVFKFSALEKAYERSTDKPSREHVTYYLYTHQDEFRISYLNAPAQLNYPKLRLCVDEEDDFTLINEIYKRLYITGQIINIRDAIELLNADKDLAEINKHVEQKIL